MKILESPVKRHIMGAFPTHSKQDNLSNNFKNLDPLALRFILHKEGFVTTEGKPTKRAAEAGLVDRCENTALWNLEETKKKLEELGNIVERSPVNQELKGVSANGEPSWVNLGTIGTYFSVSATIVGRWLDDLDLRKEDGFASDAANERGLATTYEMSTGQGKNKTRTITHWNLALVQQILIEAGHYLDFDYDKSLKGTGHNSNVKVETVDDRARSFAKDFTRIFKDKQGRRTLPTIVAKTPKPIQIKAEELIGRPGFISKGFYEKFLDRD